MSLAESGDFFDLITKVNQGNGLDNHAARFYAGEIALALDYIHAMGVIYRDLKPENIMLCGDGHVMLTDFGLAKSTRKHRTSSTVGTPAYFAPELVMSEQYSKSVDWWAYGVVVFELISGKEPFRGQNIKETMKNVVSKTPKLPPSVAKHNSKESVTNAQNFIDRLLTKNGDDRLGAMGGEEVKSHAYFEGPITHSARKPTGEDAESGCSWTWEALESKEIKPPLKRTNLLETAAMVALMEARKNQRGTTKMEDIFKGFEDFDRDKGEEEAGRGVPIRFTVSPDATPVTEKMQVEGEAMAKLSPRLQMEPIDRSDSTAQRELAKTTNLEKFPKLGKLIDANAVSLEERAKREQEEEQANELENVSDPVLRVVTYDFVPGNLEVLEKEGKLVEFERVRVKRVVKMSDQNELFAPQTQCERRRRSELAAVSRASELRKRTAKTRCSRPSNPPSPLPRPISKGRAEL